MRAFVNPVLSSQEPSNGWANAVSFSRNYHLPRLDGYIFSAPCVWSCIRLLLISRPLPPFLSPLDIFQCVLTTSQHTTRYHKTLPRPVSCGSSRQKRHRGDTCHIASSRSTIYNLSMAPLSCKMDAKVAKKKTRVVVIGSGLAGLTMAYLLHNDPQRRYHVEIFESVDFPMQLFEWSL